MTEQAPNSVAAEAGPGFRQAETERRMINMIRTGTVNAADYGSARVRVKCGDLVTGWIPWITRRASNDIDWWAPEVGEQVVILCPCGDPQQAVCLGSIFQNAHPATENRPDIHKTVYADGTTVSYDRSQGLLKVDCVNRVEIISAAHVQVTAARIDMN